MNRQHLFALTVVELADTLVDDFDAIDLLHTLTERSVTLLEADAASLILSNQRGNLEVVAATSPEAHTLDIFQVHKDEGPCVDCFHAGQPVLNVHTSEITYRWPRFSAAATAAGYESTHSLPLRLRDQVIGAMNLFCADRSDLDEDEAALGQALADIATIGLLQERVIRRQELLSEQLQATLNSRTRIEQATGVLSERVEVGIPEAFTLMRDYGQRTRRPLTEIANGVIDGSIDPAELLVAPEHR